MKRVKVLKICVTQWTTISPYAWLKDLFNAQDRSTGFNVPKHEELADLVSDPILSLIPNKLVLVFGELSRIHSHKHIWEAVVTPLPFPTASLYGFSLHTFT